MLIDETELHEAFYVLLRSIEATVTRNVRSQATRKAAGIKAGRAPTASRGFPRGKAGPQWRF